jgi:hypothetical protein
MAVVQLSQYLMKLAARMAVGKSVRTIRATLDAIHR